MVFDQAAHRLAASLAKQGQHRAALEWLGPFFCVTRKGKARFDILAELQEDSQQDKVLFVRLICTLGLAWGPSCMASAGGEAGVSCMAGHGAADWHRRSTLRGTHDMPCSCVVCRYMAAATF